MTPTGSNSWSLSRYPCEPRLHFSLKLDLLEEHGVRPNPETRPVVQGPVNDHGFKAFAMARYANNFILATLVVTKATHRGIGKRGEIRQVALDV